MTRKGEGQCAGTRGFTLIEVLVALSLIAVAALAIMKVTRDGVVTAVAVRERFFAEIVAENQLIEALNLPAAPEIGTTNGRSRMAGQDWLWRQTVSSTSDAAIKRIDVTVSLTESGDQLAALQAFRGER